MVFDKKAKTVLNPMFTMPYDYHDYKPQVKTTETKNIPIHNQDREHQESLVSPDESEEEESYETEEPSSEDEPNQQDEVQTESFLNRKRNVSDSRWQES